MHEIHHKTHKTHPTHFFIMSLFLLGALIGFIILFQSYRYTTTRAYENSVSFKVQFPGEFIPQQVVNVDITLYRSLGKVKEYKGVVFSSQYDKTAVGSITLPTPFDYNSQYAVYIKPNKYFGRLFCSSTVSGKECTTPQLLFNKYGNMINLSAVPFSGGDIPPVDGRVDAKDMSAIVANLGKTTDLSTDINSDGVTNTQDYRLAFYSINNNIRDDAYTLEIPWAPSPTLTPPAATPTFPFPHNRPTYIPSGNFIGTCQLLPAPFSARLCGVMTKNISTTVGYGTCENAYENTNKCSPVYLKRQCTCPTGKVCVCQLKDQIDQSVGCTNGGYVDILSCSK